jgi:glycosyltransferase involved in cell wall biosynthesis
MADTLSIAIVALNEEANLGRVLESVRWADEIVVVDSGSTDRTCDIAREYGARVIHEPWRGYTGQKNYALELCTKDWILSLDADEEVSPDLAEEVRAVLANSMASGGDFDGYSIRRKNLFLGRWIKHGGFYPDPKLRLFRRGMAYSTGRDPHDRFELKSGTRVGRLQNAMIHHTYPTLTLYLEHMNRYSSVWNKVPGAKPRRFSINAIVLRPLATFIYNYFFRLGFLDGREGLLLHMYHAGYVSWKYAKAWEMGRAQSEVAGKSEELHTRADRPQLGSRDRGSKAESQSSR